uniref:Specifically androgen-regulated gene protein-like n=1 Tax=Cynoglossus semilaevis TaxID=244447 RepID=A0A3P8WMJ4_CYNSE
MPRSDLRTGNIAMESLSNNDSAGSCESVISVNSAFVSDSMEHLSAEERACLMYLEETIEALEVQEDSGFSNDEPDWSGKTASDRDEHQTLNHTTKIETHLVSETNTHLPSSSEKGTQPQPVTDESVPSASPSRVLCVTTDASGHPKIIASTSLHSAQPVEPSENNLVLIPPPSDFMDKPNPPVDLEQLRQRARVGKTSESSSVFQESSTLSEVPSCVSASPAIYLPPEAPHVIPDDLRSPLPEHMEPKSPPAVAPKPKKHPANIIRKSPNTSGAGTDSNLGHFVPSEQERVHMEALRKLGLLKGDETDSSPVQTPPSPVSPATPRTPSFNRPPVSVPALSPPVDAASVNAKVSEILPVPAAFSDPIGQEEAAAKDVLDVSPNQKTPGPHLPSPSMTRHPAPPNTTGVKSATLERSGPGLSSLMAGQDFNLASQLRKSRPRPASLGSGKEFTSTQGKDVQAAPASSPQPDSRRSVHDYSALQRSQKLPRSEGVSVLICPRSDNEEARRKALKKLGLLRD